MEILQFRYWKPSDHRSDSGILLQTIIALEGSLFHYDKKRSSASQNSARDQVNPPPPQDSNKNPCKPQVTFQEDNGVPNQSTGANEEDHWSLEAKLGRLAAEGLYVKRDEAGSKRSCKRKSTAKEQRSRLYKTVSRAVDKGTMDECINLVLENEWTIAEMMGLDSLSPAVKDLMEEEMKFGDFEEEKEEVGDDNLFKDLPVDDDLIDESFLAAGITFGDFTNDDFESDAGESVGEKRKRCSIPQSNFFFGDDSGHEYDSDDEYDAERDITATNRIWECFLELIEIPGTVDLEAGETRTEVAKCYILDDEIASIEVEEPVSFGKRKYPKSPQPEREEELYQVTTNCIYVEYGGEVYEQHSSGDWYGTRVGNILPENVVVSSGAEIFVKGSLKSKYLLKCGRGHKARCMLRSPFLQSKQASCARRYTWFKSIRENFSAAASTVETVLSAGTSHNWERTLYTDHNQRKVNFIIYQPALESLNSKVVNAVTIVNNKSLLKKLIEENMHVPLHIIMDTAVYFVERRALLQKQLSGTTDACITFLEDKKAWVQPEGHEGKDPSVDPAKRAAMQEGVYPFTSVKECIDIFREGATCCARVGYTHADASYDVYEESIYPNYMYEPLNEREGEKSALRGVKLDENGLKFRTQIDKDELGYQTVGTHWATQAAVITTGSTLEYEKSSRRLIQGRDDDPLLRERAGLMAAQGLRYLAGMLTLEKESFDAVTELKNLTESIRKVDPAYVGQGFNTFVCAELCVDTSSVQLTETDKNLCSIEAAMAFCRAQEELAGQGGRSVDEYNHLIEYIDELGAKIAERHGYVKASKDFEKESQRFLNVQMKPHEPQKVKKGKLKFGRMVVSIVGEGWIEANPTVWYDNKHMLEEPIRVVNHGDTFSIILREVTRTFEYPFKDAGKMQKNFYGQTVITKTKLDGLSEVLSDMDNEAQMDENLYCFCNHGDDMLSRYTNEHNKSLWCEGDLANNDSSHVDASFREAYLVDRYRGENVLNAYSQLAYPVKFVNPNLKTEFGFYRSRHGMRLPSGSVLTTYGNSKKSEGVGLSHAFYGLSFQESATKMGCEVTTVEGELEDISFLSKVFYRDLDGKIECALDLASVARKLGCLVGDALGSKKVPVCHRIVDATIEVVKGHIHEPNSLFMTALRRKFDTRESTYDSLKRKFGIGRKLFKESDLTYIDFGILSHYYDKESMMEGIADYLRCVNQLMEAPQYGATIYSSFVDRTMKVRYGMAPTVVE